jgi:hypothetical protein
MQTDQTVNSFWHGPKLGDIHGACIRSFMRHGHHARLHCYTPPEDVPDGVEVFDARQVMPQSDLLKDGKTGSVALGADRYRYRLIEAGLGIYADCDMYLIRPLPKEDYLIGFQSDAGTLHAVNGALLRYQPSSGLSQALARCTMHEHATLPWKRRRRHVLNSFLRPFGLAPSARHESWGVWGPALLSYWIKELDLASLCKPIDVFYPLHYFMVDLLFDPGLRLEDLVTPRTVAIHLCHKMSGTKPIPPGCPMDQIVREDA